MKKTAILSVSLLSLLGLGAAQTPETSRDERYRALAAAANAPKPDIESHYKEGQRLFGEKNFEMALAEFEKVDELAPEEPQVYSWIGAALNELGRHAEARTRLEAAFELLRARQKAAQEQGQPAAPIDAGYYVLLSRILASLGEFDQAVATLDSFVPPEAPEAASKAEHTLAAARTALKAQLVAKGKECLDRDDLECAAGLLARAEGLNGGSGPGVWETVAREAAAAADRAPASNEEEQAAKAVLQAKAITAHRLWAEKAPSFEAKRSLARALSATKQPELTTEAIAVLESLAAEATGEGAKELQLDLALAHAALEQWERSAKAATTYITLAPDDALGQGYCLRSLARFQMGSCEQALADGEHCKNADGTPRSLRHLDTCRDRIARAARQEANEAAKREADLRRQCKHLYERGKWARSFLEGIEFDDLVRVIGDFRANEGECAAYFEEVEKSAGSNGFSSPTPVLCAAGVKTASYPMNLSLRSREEIASLRDQTKTFLDLCRPSLDAGQAQEVLQGLHKVEEALDRPR